VDRNFVISSENNWLSEAEFQNKKFENYHLKASVNEWNPDKLER